MRGLGTTQRGSPGHCKLRKPECTEEDQGSQIKKCYIIFLKITTHEVAIVLHKVAHFLKSWH